VFSIQYLTNDNYRIADREYKINASFDNILRLLDLFDDRTTPDYMKIDIALQMLLDDPLEHLEYAVKYKIVSNILKRYLDNEQEVLIDIAGNVIDLPTPDKEQVIDFNVDAELIYSAFMQAYGIDLIDEQGKLHWLKFRALLHGLPTETRLMEIIGYRSWTESTKSMKQIMREQKQKYRLKGGNNG